MNRTEIPVANPCHADWSTMTLADRGRFCGQCRKVVKELRQMTEGEARDMLASPPTEGLCVRYIHDATGEIVFRRDDVIPVGKLVRRAAMIALAAALPLSTAACMGAAAPTLMGSPPNVAPQPSASTPAVVMGGMPAMPMPPASASTDSPAPVAPVAK